MPSPNIIKRFKGLNNYDPYTTVGLDSAIDLLNVFISSNGRLEKIRIPIPFISSFSVFRKQLNLFNFRAPVSGYNRLVLSGDTSFEQVIDIKAGTLKEYNAIFQPQEGSTLGGSTSSVDSNNLLFQANGQAMWKLFPLDAVPDARGGTNPPLQGWGYLAPTFRPGIAIATGPSSTALAFGWNYGIAFKSAITGHISSMCPVRPVTDPITYDVGPQANLPIVTLSFPAQITGASSIDTYVIYRTRDGGSNYYVLAEVTSNTTSYVDNATPDNSLNQLRQAQFINNPPPIGKYLVKFGGRIVVVNLLGAPQNFAWSGYEQILDGRPEESFPPGNQGVLQLNNNELTGAGALPNGLVFFSSDDKMYWMQGTLSDVTISQPVVYTEYMTDLPFNLGCLTHFSIVSTPYGLVFMGTDQALHIFNGIGTPSELAWGATIFFQGITPGFEGLIRATYWNYADRDWYVMAMPYGGSNRNNIILFVDLNPNASANAGVFVSDIQADDVAVSEDANGVRNLVILQNGNVKQIYATEVSKSGYPTNRNARPPASGTLNAYWDSGYSGNEDPHVWKTFRYIDVVTDSVTNFSYKLVDDDSYTFVNPRIGKCKVGSIRNRYFINLRQRRCGIRIDFDSQDYSQNVLELRLTYNTVGVR